jgi:glycosyltransferase involved in cell wall biosynthesis
MVGAWKAERDRSACGNESTVRAFPGGYRGKVIRLFESGVDLKQWKPAATLERGEAPARFVFSGRFVNWEGVQFLVPAFAKAAAAEPRCRLDLVGGELESEIRAVIKQRHLKGSVQLHGVGLADRMLPGLCMILTLL